MNKFSLCIGVDGGEHGGDHVGLGGSPDCRLDRVVDKEARIGISFGGSERALRGERVRMGGR